MAEADACVISRAPLTASTRSSSVPVSEHLSALYLRVAVKRRRTPNKENIVEAAFYGLNNSEFTCAHCTQ